MDTDTLANRLEIAIDAERLLKGEPMSAHTTFKVGGPVDFFASIASVDELVAVLDACRQANAPWHVIGCGSDLLVADEGIEGVCICLGEHFAGIRVDGTRVIAQAGATNEQVAEAACEARALRLRVRQWHSRFHRRGGHHERRRIRRRVRARLRRGDLPDTDRRGRHRTRERGRLALPALHDVR